MRETLLVSPSGQVDQVALFSLLACSHRQGWVTACQGLGSACPPRGGKCTEDLLT